MSPTAQSTSTMRPHVRQIRWWWLSPARASYRAGEPGGLDAPEQPLVGEHGERVVHRLLRDRAQLGGDPGVDLVGGAVGVLRHDPEDGQALGGDLQTVLAEEGADVLVGGHGAHASRLWNSPESVPPQSRPGRRA